MLQGITLDQDTAEQLRLELAEKRGSNSSKSGGKARGPVDSGKGVRVQVSCAGANWTMAVRPGWLRLHVLTHLSVLPQGGKVYDSERGVTCHW